MYSDFEEKDNYVIVAQCDSCHENIKVDDKYIELDDGRLICEYCIEDMQTEALLELLGKSYIVAEENVPEEEEMRNDFKEEEE